MISNSIKRSSDRFGRHTRKICVWFFSVNYSDFPVYSRTLLCSGLLNSSSVARMITFVAQVTYSTLQSPVPNENYQKYLSVDSSWIVQRLSRRVSAMECYNILICCYYPFKMYEHNDFSVR